MKKKLLLSLLLVLSLFIFIGCSKEETNNGEEGNGSANKETVEANFKFGWVRLYMPSSGYEYRPDLRGLIYTEDQRKLYIKGDPNDRSEAIIIDLMQEQYNDYLENYINAKNANLGDDGWKLKSEKPKYFAREKYEGKSGDTVIYNYTYITKFNDYVYTITVSGPQKYENDLNDLTSKIKKSLIVGE